MKRFVMHGLILLFLFLLSFIFMSKTVFASGTYFFESNVFHYGETRLILDKVALENYFSGFTFVSESKTLVSAGEDSIVWIYYDDISYPGGVYEAYEFYILDADLVDYVVVFTVYYYVVDNTFYEIDYGAGTVFTDSYLDFSTKTSYSYRSISTTDQAAFDMELTYSPIYTVEYDSNEGTSVSSELVLIGDYASEPSDPTRTHYTFDGWYEDEGVWSELWDTEQFGTQAINYDLTLYAKWTIDQHTITFNSNGGSAVDAQMIDYDGYITEPSPPTKAGFTFAGWFTDDGTFVDAWLFTFDTVEEDTTLYAQWGTEVYIVTFIENGGSLVDDYYDVIYDSTIPKPTDPTRENYSFLGWYQNEDLTDEWSFSNDTVQDDLTLYAKWKLDIDHSINDWFDSIGLASSWGKLFVSFAIMIAIVVFLSIIGVPSLMVFLITMISLVLMAALSIIPGWIMILLVILLMALLYIVFKSGIGGGDDD